MLLITSWVNWPIIILFYANYPDTLTPYHTHPNIWPNPLYYLFLCWKAVGWLANSTDPDQKPPFAASVLGLYCAQGPTGWILSVNNIFAYANLPLSYFPLGLQANHLSSWNHPERTKIPLNSLQYTTVCDSLIFNAMDIGWKMYIYIQKM